MDLFSARAAAARDRLRRRFGSAADTWWAEMPGLLRDLAARWELDLGEPVGSGNTSLVLRCRTAGRAAILKITPDAAIATAEAAALRVWAPTGRVPAVYAEAGGALLLEALPSETTLADRPAPAPLHDVADLIRALHGSSSADRAADRGFGPPTDRTDLLFTLWQDRAAGDPDQVAALARGHALARELAAAPPRLVLAHGDLHPGNVLPPGNAARGLVAIDPRPCLADPASDAIDWVVLGDPARWRATAEELADLIDVDVERLWAWCRAFAARLAATEDDPGRRHAFRDIAA
ncbi:MULTISPECIES: aminoglycoside phosphotransferase family protein [Prauserella salsuginis group]|uniref:Aminoglycoside phosphotransferase family protein n=1 Tax=Prauserella salsuginis TaxID=387889 RepID=A0ABW6GBT2_9PSEU|nr:MULTISPECIES: aminoglycoside phosphotransferase family protein [Prauserella salsuginis group]MCR3722319.1 streptomycin 6-kinase [Prauserella flava]MCR3736317.1 streptomycin 6-kinase [Prauserella salsuginis]